MKIFLNVDIALNVLDEIKNEKPCKCECCGDWKKCVEKTLKCVCCRKCFDKIDNGKTFWNVISAINILNEVNNRKNF